MEDEQEYTLIEYAPGFMFVNVYEVWREYGGPEEGGWCFDAGSLVKSRQVSESDVEATVSKLAEEYPNTGKYCSVIYTGGDYRIRVESEPGADYPAVTPHYE